MISWIWVYPSLVWTAWIFYWKAVHSSKTSRHNNQDCLTERQAVQHSKQLWTPAQDYVWLRLHTRVQIVFPAGTLPQLWNVSHPTHGPTLGVCREWVFISSPKMLDCVHVCIRVCFPITLFLVCFHSRRIRMPERQDLELDPEARWRPRSLSRFSTRAIFPTWTYPGLNYTYFSYYSSGMVHDAFLFYEFL